jgi:pyrroloquinoline quinone (PQQ) biosynthesis protein C
LPNFFIDLVTDTDEARREFETHPVVFASVADGMSIERYRALLGELYQIVWHFNPICAAAASRITDEYANVRDFLYRHMHEEAGHEQWVLNDLEAVGVSREHTIARSASANVLALLGYNYWASDRKHPCSVLGMMYVLEVLAAVYGGPFSTTIRETLFLEGERGTSFLSSHASLDAAHMVELRNILNQLTLADAQNAVIESVRVNFRQITSVFAAV